MIEVFKTDVEYPSEAEMLIRQIHENLPGYKAGFDLEDCDRILRVKCTCGVVPANEVINLLSSFGYNAAVLTDEVYPFIPIDMFV